MHILIPLKCGGGGGGTYSVSLCNLFALKVIMWQFAKVIQLSSGPLITINKSTALLIELNRMKLLQTNLCVCELTRK